MNTRFYAGYLLGYPNYVALHDEELAYTIRVELFRSAFGEMMEDVLGRIQQHRDSGDHQLNLGIQFGEGDGEEFFVAVEEGGNPYGPSGFGNLQHAAERKLIDYGSLV